MTPLVVLGGTFDPVHVAHLVLGECARVQFGAERVVFLPAGDPYRKTGTGGRGAGPGGGAVREVTAAKHRLAMLRLAVAGNEHFVADDREVRRGGPTYTIDTLDELHAEGVRDIVLILGTDALADMPNWKEPARIREMARIAVVAKPGWEAPPGVLAGIEQVQMPAIGVSSTLIRERVAARLPVRYLVPDPVLAYIEEHGLYR